MTGLAAVALALLAAGSAANEDPAAPADTPPRRETPWFVLPVVFSLPETSIAYGATGGVHLVRPGLRTSSIQPTAFYTLKHQAYARSSVSSTTPTARRSPRPSVAPITPASSVHHTG